MLRGLLASLIFTPWFINLQETTLAPALMIAMLDMITLGSAEVFRAGVPLFLSIFTFQAIVLDFIFLKKSQPKRLVFNYFLKRRFFKERSLDIFLLSVFFIMEHCLLQSDSKY